jgi:hypothetical protein
VPLKAGRDFTAQDTRDKTLVTIVNETLARTMWPGENPIGKRFACCEDNGPKGRMNPVWHEIVGVVGDVRAQGLDRQVLPEFLPSASADAANCLGLDRTHHGLSAADARGHISGQRFANYRGLDCARRTHLPTLDRAAED